MLITSGELCLTTHCCSYSDVAALLPVSAIDNATRSLINMGQLPVTCGLFFSLGHSTIVIAVVSGSFSKTILHEWDS